MTTDDPHAHNPHSDKHHQTSKNEGDTPWDLVLSRLDRVQQGGGGVTAACPAHDDRRNSLSVGKAEDGTVLLHCFVGCSVEQIVAALGLSLADLFPANRSAQSITGLTLEEYALAKRLPPDFLKERFRLRTTRRKDQLCVEMPSFDGDGRLIATTYRMKLTKTDGIDARFERKKGDPAVPYGLWRLATARERNFVTLVEGESDVQTLALYDEPALGVAGANAWNDERDAPALEGIETVFLVVERDRGGAVLKTTIARSPLRPRVRTIDLGELKDPSGLHCDDPDRFRERWELAKAAALPLPDPEDTTAADAQVAFTLARDLLHAADLLDQIRQVITAHGYAGDPTPVMAAYLAITSRLLATPMNMAFVAPSGAGKNRAVDEARVLHPAEAVFMVKAASERALIYNQEQFQHRTVIFAEADSIPEEGPAASAIRNLASDNVMEYEVTVRDEHSGDFTTRLICKPGPTGLITTSIRSAREQLSTRMLEFQIPDDIAQTRAVMYAQARRAQGPAAFMPDLEPFLAVQQYLELAGNRNVAVPFASVLADLLPAGAVRTRRDFPQLLTAIQTVAFLHQLQRTVTSDGWIQATIQDYAQVWQIFGPCFDVIAAEGVTPPLREIVNAVRDDEELTLHEIAERVGKTDSTVSYHVKRAVANGWLTTDGGRGRRGAKIKRGSALPEARSALPEPERLREIFESSSQNREEGNPSSDEEESPPSGSATPSQPSSPESAPIHASHIVVKASTETTGIPSSRFRLEDSKISLITDAASLRAHLPLLESATVLGVDCETTGLDPLSDQLRAVSIATEHHILMVDVPAVTGWAELLGPVLRNLRITKVFHNAKFDLAFLAQAGVIVDPVFDTMLVSQLLDGGKHLRSRVSNPSGAGAGGKSTVGFHSLEALAARELDIVLNKSLQKADWSGELTADQVEYAALDAGILLALHAILQKRLEKEHLLDVACLEFEATPALVSMERTGVPIDVDAWTLIRDQAKQEMTRLEAEIGQYLPDVNLASHQQLKTALASLGVDLPDTQESTLQSVCDAHPAVALLVAHRESATRVKTFGDGFLKFVHPHTKRIHADFHQIGAATGRMACSKPNLQNIPRDASYRACVRPGAGRALVRADLALIELCAAAELTGDQNMIDAITRGDDLHRLTAAAIFAKAPEEVSKDERAFGKIVNFGTLYGQGRRGLIEAGRKHGLTLSADDADEIQRRFALAWPQLAKWRKAKLAGTVDRIRTASGRLRLLDSDAPGTVRVNTPVQGMAADGFKAALGEVWRTRDRYPTAAPILAVHDELVIECDEVDANAVAAWVQECLENGMKRYITRVPVRVDVTAARDWSGTPLEVTSSGNTEEA